MARRLRAVDEIVHWKSLDGFDIEGVLTIPPESVALRLYKLLVMPHGGPTRAARAAPTSKRSFSPRAATRFFQPNFRGSLGYGVRFSMPTGRT